MKEIERFIAEETSGKRYTVSCLQESRKTENGELLDLKHYKTSNGEFLKAIDEFTFNVLGSGKIIHRNRSLKSIKFHPPAKIEKQK